MPLDQQTDEAQILDIVQRGVDDGRLRLLRTDAANDPISEDLHLQEHLKLSPGKRLYFDNVQFNP